MKKFIIFSILLFVFLLRVPFFSEPLDYDEGTYAFFAFFSKGGEFYSPLPIGRLPGIIFAYRFLDNLFPGKIAAFRIAAALLIVLATFAIYKLGESLDNQETGLLSALLFGLYASRISTASPANTEFFMVSFTVMSFSSFWLFKKSKKFSWLALAGFFSGIAVFFKQVAFFETLFLSLWLLINNFKNRKLKVKPLFKQGAVFLTSFSIPILICFLFFFLRGEFSDFWWQSFGSGGEYWRYAWQDGQWFIRLGRALKDFWRHLWFLGLISLGGLIILFSKLEKRSFFILGWGLSALIGVSFTSWFFLHYFVQLTPVLALLGGFFLSQAFWWLKNNFFRHKFLTNTFWIGGIFLFCLFFVIFPPYSSYLKMVQKKISKTEYLKKIGFDVEEAGWLPFYQSAAYLREKMKNDESLFVWSTTPVSYYLTRKYPTTSFVQNYPLLDYQFMLPTALGWQFDFEGNRRQLISELNSSLPNYILVDVNPEQIFDQMMLFKDFGNFINNHYQLEKQFNNLLVFKQEQKQRPKFLEITAFSSPFELVKRFSAITEVKAKGLQTEITFEPMVNPQGKLRNFKQIYPGLIDADFQTLSLQFLGQDGYDFVSHGSFKPSGISDFHLKVEGLAKPVSFVRVKIDNSAWNNRHYGVNEPLKVVQRAGILDLYFEPISGWQNKQLEVYIIYNDGTIARAEIFNE